MDDAVRQAMLAMLPRLRRFAVGLTGTAADGDDLVQATYERAIRHIDSWTPGSRLDSWMFRIARNLFLNELRADRTRRRHLRAVDDGEPASDGGGAFEQRLLLGAVRRLLGRLPEEQRAALLLVAVEGLSYAETARILELPVGTVTSRVARARIALKQMVDGGLADGRRREDAGKARL